MVYTIKNNQHYLIAKPFALYVDRQALLYIVNGACTPGRITRWLLLLQEFQF